jgi:hypothetical protein
VTQKEFDGPTQAIEFGDIHGGERDGIQQGSGQSNGAGSEASGLDGEFQNANGPGFRSGVELWLRKPVGTFAGFTPGDQAIAPSEPLALSPIDVAGLAQTEDRIHPFVLKSAHIREGAEAAVAEHKLESLHDGGPESMKEGTFMIFFEASFGKSVDGACGEGEDGDEFDHGKSTAGFLFRGLRGKALIGGGVRHG